MEKHSELCFIYLKGGGTPLTLFQWDSMGGMLGRLGYNPVNVRDVGLVRFEDNNQRNMLWLLEALNEASQGMLAEVLAKIHLAGRRGVYCKIEK